MNSWANLVPAVRQARSYERSWLKSDIAAGLVICGMLAPAGMAYAAAAGLSPITGLYATIVPLLAYAVFGPSRIMVLGPDSSLTPLLIAAFAPAAIANSREALAVAGALGILAGVICIAAGLSRFGFLAELLSTPVRYGYLAGIVVTIIVSQAAQLCGFSVKSESLVRQLQQFTDGVRNGQTNGWAISVGLGSVLFLLIVRHFSSLIPGTLVAVVVGIGLGVALHLNTKDVALVGDLPRGLPTPAIPDVSWHTVRTLLGASMGIAFVAFADTSVLSRTMSLRRHEAVDANHELVALGIANVASGLFHGMPVSASNSRTPVAESAGAKTQLTGVVAALCLIIVTVAAPATFRYLPKATLAAIVIVAAISLIDLHAVVRLYRVRRSEFLLAISAFLAVAALGAIDGVAIAVVLSLLNFLRLVWKPHTAELVRVEGLKGYHDRARHPEGRVVPGLMLYRFDAPLFFANARYFSEDLNRRIALQHTLVRRVVITAEPITDIDTSASETLRDLVDDLAGRNIELRFCELKGLVHDRLERYGTFRRGEADYSARTTGEAVKQYVHDHPSDWVDWEDRQANSVGQSPKT